MGTLPTLALLALLGTPQDPQTAGTKTFTDPAMGLSFVHPESWTRVTLKRPEQAKRKRTITDVFKKGQKAPPKEDDGMVVFSIPNPGAPPAELTVVRASFSGAPEKWQEIQADSNRNLRRDVERQWEQDILGVPMLLTRIGYVQDGVPTTTVTGLLYNASANKLLFRLTGPTAGFDAVQYQFTGVLESLRTTNDALPAAQEPGKEVAAPKGQTPDAKHSVFEPTKKGGPVAAPTALAVSVGGRKMTLRVPEDWTLAGIEGDTATLRHPDLKSPVTVSLYAAATAPRPTEALTAATNKTLAEYKSVAVREDTPGTPNKAGNPVLAVWRRGEGASGALATLDAVATVGDYYLMFAFRPSPGADLKDERRVVQRMLNAVGLEPAP